MSKRISTHGSFEKIETWRYGPLMDALNINMVRNIGPKLAHDGAVHVVGGASETESSIVLEYTSGKNDYAVTIYKTSDDCFVCGYCSSDKSPVAWCTHIHHALTSRFDYQLFNNDGRYIIPVVPSEGIFCPAHVDRVENERSKHLPGLRKISVVMQNLETEADDIIVIGYLKDGHFGNADIRNLFSDWVVGSMDDKRYFTDTMCTGAQHDKIGKGDQTLSEFGKRFYPAMYGMCPVCVKDYEKEQNSGAEDAPQF